MLHGQSESQNQDIQKLTAKLNRWGVEIPAENKENLGELSTLYKTTKEERKRLINNLVNEGGVEPIREELDKLKKMKHADLRQFHDESMPAQVLFYAACHDEDAFLRLMQRDPVYVSKMIAKLRTDYILKNYPDHVSANATNVAGINNDYPLKPDFNPYQFPAPFLEFSVQKIIQLLEKDGFSLKSLFGESKSPMNNPLPAIPELEGIYKPKIEVIRERLNLAYEAGYPYQETMEAILDYLNIMEEVNVYKLCNAYVNKNKYNAIFLERAMENFINKNNTEEHEQSFTHMADMAVRVKKNNSNAEDQDLADAVKVPNIQQAKDFMFGKNTLWGAETTPLRSVDNMIFIPQFNALDTLFFNKNRPANIFPMGLTEPTTCYQHADSYKIPSYQFAAHDLFHTHAQISFSEDEKWGATGLGFIYNVIFNNNLKLMIEKYINAHQFEQFSVDEFVQLQRIPANVSATINDKLKSYCVTHAMASDISHRSKDVEAFNAELTRMGKKLYESLLFGIVHELGYDYAFMLKCAIEYGDDAYKKFISGIAVGILQKFLSQTEFNGINIEDGMRDFFKIIHAIPNKETYFEEIEFNREKLDANFEATYNLLKNQKEVSPNDYLACLKTSIMLNKYEIFHFLVSDSITCKYKRIFESTDEGIIVPLVAATVLNPGSNYLKELLKKISSIIIDDKFLAGFIFDCIAYHEESRRNYGNNIILLLDKLKELQQQQKITINTDTLIFSIIKNPIYSGNSFHLKLLEYVYNNKSASEINAMAPDCHQLAKHTIQQMFMYIFSGKLTDHEKWSAVKLFKLIPVGVGLVVDQMPQDFQKIFRQSEPLKKEPMSQKLELFNILLEIFNTEDHRKIILHHPDTQTMYGAHAIHVDHMAQMCGYLDQQNLKTAIVSNEAIAIKFFIQLCHLDVRESSQEVRPIIKQIRPIIKQIYDLVEHIMDKEKKTFDPSKVNEKIIQDARKILDELKSHAKILHAPTSSAENTGLKRPDTK